MEFLWFTRWVVLIYATTSQTQRLVPINETKSDSYPIPRPVYIHAGLWYRLQSRWTITIHSCPPRMSHICPTLCESHDKYKNSAQNETPIFLRPLARPPFVEKAFTITQQ
jgi:hypothetical protein